MTDAIIDYSIIGFCVLFLLFLFVAGPSITKRQRPEEKWGVAGCERCDGFGWFRSSNVILPCACRSTGYPCKKVKGA